MKIALIIMLALAATVVGGALLAGPKLQAALSALKPEPSRTEVRLEILEPRTLVEFVSAPGEVEPRTKVDISALVSARIEDLPLREGDEVRKGDVIVRLDDRDLQAVLESAKARRDGERFRLESERARLGGLLNTLAFARKELQRQQDLYETGDVSRKIFDNAEERVVDLESSVNATHYSLSVIESSLAGSESDITRAKDGLDNTVILAPMDGLITALNMEVGEQVLGTFNNIGSTIMTIADLSRMILKAHVAESDIASLKEGQAAKVHINAYPDVVFSGTVTQIALQRSTSSDGSGIFETEVEIDLQGRRIYSGLTANVDIDIATHEGLVVPSQTIVERMVEDLPDEIRRSELVDQSKRTTSVVYRVVDGKAVCTPVKPGPSDLTHTVILEGLSAGDAVITRPYKVLEKIKDGELVKEEDKDDESLAGDEAEGDGEATPDDGSETASTETGAPADPDDSTDEPEVEAAVETETER